MKPRTEHAIQGPGRGVLRLGLCAALMGAVLLLQACGSSPSKSGEIRTEIDKTDQDRRAGVHIELATGYMTRGQYTTALDEIKQALQVKPGMHEAVNLRNLVYAAMGETAMAEEGFKRALVNAPQDPDAAHNYGWFLCQQGRIPQAIGLFDQALAQPSYRGQARTLLARGVCEARGGQLDKAEHSLSSAFELEPGNPGIQLNLAEVLYREQQYERARFYVRRVNAQAELVNASSLWLELRIERKLGNPAGADEIGRQMRQRFPEANQTRQLKDGRFDD